MKVDHKYKKKEVITLDVALRSVGIGLPFKLVDLIHDTLKVLEEKGDQMTLMDASKLEVANEEKWMRYEIEKAQDPKTKGRDMS